MIDTLSIPDKAERSGLNLPSVGDSVKTKVIPEKEKLTSSAAVAHLCQGVDSAGLSVFRLALGISVAYFAWKTLAHSLILTDYIQPRLHLTYFGFEWVKPWPKSGMYLHFVAMFLGGIGMAVGLYYRLAALVVLYTFTHAFLIERTLYNNHYYLIILLVFLANVLPLHAGWSVDSAMNPGRYRQCLPRWMLWLIRFQVGVVYFYGGIAKIDGDWLRGQPLGMWLQDRSGLPLLGPVLGMSITPMVFSYAGLLIDLLAVPLLCWKPTRIPIYVILLLFHLLNSLIFTIGLFPWLMMAETLIFFPPEWPRKLFGIPTAFTREQHGASFRWTIGGRTLGAVLVVFLLVQILLPFRHLLDPGNASWTEYGQLFAWRMMLRQKLTGMRFLSTDPKTGKTEEIDVKKYLTPRQAIQMSRDPDLIVQFANLLSEVYRLHGKKDVQIKAKILASLNGRKPQLLIDPEIDLTEKTRSLFPLSWIIPLSEPFLAHPWYYPVAEWEDRIPSRLGESDSPLSKPEGISDPAVGEESYSR